MASTVGMCWRLVDITQVFKQEIRSVTTLYHYAPLSYVTAAGTSVAFKLQLRVKADGCWLFRGRRIGLARSYETRAELNVPSVMKHTRRAQNGRLRRSVVGG